MISAVLHTYNEEKNIKRCLNSLSWVDEIILVDMGSTDQTCRMAREYKAKIFQHEYTGFVEPARNFGLSKATGDWIIVVDADEEIPKNLAHYLKEETKSPRGDFYRIARKNIIFNKWMRHTGWWPDYQIRFFKNGSVSWTEKIHGVPLTTGKGIDIESYEDLSIMHYNYQSIDKFIERLNRYTTISAKELFLSNIHFFPQDLFEKPTREFITRYFIWEGYKDGLHGLALSFIQSFSEVVTYLKLWELYNFKEEKVSLEKTELYLTNEYKTKKYWLFTVFLKNPHNIFQDILWKIRKKFYRHE